MTQLQIDFTANASSALIAMLKQKVPARARNADPQTSHDAAALWGDHKLTATQAYVLSFFLERGRGTDGELEEWIGKTYPGQHFGASSLRKRRGDLVEKGVLRDSGARDDKRKMIVWELTEAK